MMIDKTDFLNGVRGILEAFEYDEKDVRYWEDVDISNWLKLIHWKDHEIHLYSWHLGRECALNAIARYFSNSEN